MDLAESSASLVMGKGFTTREGRKQKEKADITAGKNRIFQAAHAAPDEIELARTARRRQAKRRGSRVKTVLTDERLG